MITKQIIGLIVGLAVLGGAVLLYTQKASVKSSQNDLDKNNPALSKEETGDTASTTTSDNGPKDIVSAMKAGGSWMCTVSHGSNIAESKGITYVNGRNIRGNFESDVPNIGKVQSSMIADEDNVYVWTSMVNMGFKAPREEEDPTAKATAESEYSYDCKPWTVDLSMFEIPTDIKFVESAQMGQ